MRIREFWHRQSNLFASVGFWFYHSKVTKVLGKEIVKRADTDDPKSSSNWPIDHLIWPQHPSFLIDLSHSIHFLLLIDSFQMLAVSYAPSSQCPATNPILTQYYPVDKCTMGRVFSVSGISDFDKICRFWFVFNIFLLLWSVSFVCSASILESTWEFGSWLYVLALQSLSITHETIRYSIYFLLISPINASQEALSPKWATLMTTAQEVQQLLYCNHVQLMEYHGL